jgi:hypothetical protein
MYANDLLAENPKLFTPCGEAGHRMEVCFARIRVADVDGEEFEEAPAAVRRRLEDRQQ